MARPSRHMETWPRLARYTPSSEGVWSLLHIHNAVAFLPLDGCLSGTDRVVAISVAEASATEEVLFSRPPTRHQPLRQSAPSLSSHSTRHLLAITGCREIDKSSARSPLMRSIDHLGFPPRQSGRCRKGSTRSAIVDLRRCYRGRGRSETEDGGGALVIYPTHSLLV